MVEETIEVEPPIQGASIVVKRNFRGEYGWKIKISYNSDIEDAEDIVTQIETIDIRLRQRFLKPGER